MKTHRVVLGCLRVAVVCVMAGGANRAAAVAGIGDTVIIAADLTDNLKWPRELEQWQLLIESTTQQIERADQIIRLAGDPKFAVQQFVRSVPDLMKPVDDAIGLETRQHALKMANDIYHLKSVAVQTYKDGNNIGGEYQAFGETVKRDPKRYTHFVLQEAMNARYKKAVANAESVEASEMKIHREALAGLKTAKTQTEISVFNGIIAASRERLDLAHAKAAQAKAELDAFNGQLGVENARKAEADREWAQKVVEELRQRALDAYQAQFASSDHDPAT